MDSNHPTNSMLFQPLRLGALQLEHRVVLGPCTRMRSTLESDGVYVPNEINATYYAQRASNGGFMLTEATPISRYAAGYPGVPGIFTQSQIAGWKKVTMAVHLKGAYIFCQLWHVGRATVPSLIGGRQAVSSTNIPISGKALDGTDFTAFPPKAMTVAEIRETADEFAKAAQRAMEAGFDGVEIHGANGYLLEQFIHDNVNQRTDQYGGSIQNRCRFPLEVICAVTRAVGAGRVGVRLSPYNHFQDTRDSNRHKHWIYLCSQIAALPEEFRPAYVHMAESRLDEPLEEQAAADCFAAYVDGHNDAEAVVATMPQGNWLNLFRDPLKKGGVAFIAAGNFDSKKAMAKVDADAADAIAFGRFFISNPDLPRRLQEGLPLNPYDRSTFYGAEPPSKGYIDYPFYGQENESTIHTARL